MYLVSATSPFANGCDGNPSSGTLYVNSEVEPYVAVDQRNTQHIVGVWQQDRWSEGGARGLMSAASFDGGKTWIRKPLPFSLCGGGTISNGGAYPFASDPWVTIGPTGVVYAISLSFGGVVAGGTNSAVLASRSLDGGRTWSNPSTLVLDEGAYYSDKESITADPSDPNLVYAVWDRGPANVDGAPATFARSTDAGATWEPAHSIFDPGSSAQTIGNEIVVLPNGTLVDLFTQLNFLPNNNETAEAVIVRSSDHGVTWSGPIKIADLEAVGARDPETGKSVRDGADLPQMAVAPNGTLFMTWADGRFSNGARDAIALTRSSDGGTTWSTPVAINADTAAEAFEPSVHVRDDGTVTVTYYDFRNDTSDASTLPTILWLTHSSDTIHWTESAVAGPFNLGIAPDARGLFLGDYQGLSSLGNITAPFFVITNSGNTANRTDIFSEPQLIATTIFKLMSRTLSVSARPAPTQTPSPEFLGKVSANLLHVLERRESEGHEVKRLRPIQPTRPKYRS